ncbi:hypothetical protein EJ08DRAFT_174147 [Tothia fuscella]|uniref:SigF-like NTF2-like domain-containing protein n=1 Tax=Tothia fuscella TaxID=1048955 RepID=A0A9P4NU23_9PEZI|nr:hypothetical protein EJ08DRAFT_174147 [Tothia fuscella]
MEDPVAEIPHIIHLLTQSPPATQLSTLNRYFTPTASFTHPFVRTGSWDHGNGWNSRWATSRIYRWYKIMSPKIWLDVTSVAMDKQNNILYVGVSQTFRIFIFVPLGYRADVNLTSKLMLTYYEDEKKYYIASQDDLYQSDEFTKFIWFGIWRFVWFWQVISAWVCVFLAIFAAPLSWAEDTWHIQEVEENSSTTSDLQVVDDLERD